MLCNSYSHHVALIQPPPSWAACHCCQPPRTLQVAWGTFLQLGWLHFFIWNSVRGQGSQRWASEARGDLTGHILLTQVGLSPACREEGLFLRGSHEGSRASGLALPDFYLQGGQDLPFLIIKEGSGWLAMVTASQGTGVQPSSLSHVHFRITASKTRSSILYETPTFFVPGLPKQQ